MAKSSEHIPLSEAKSELSRINDFLSSPHLLIGGLAVNQFVPTRDSADIDLVCDFETARDLMKSLYLTKEWNIEDKNQDEYRPSYLITPLFQKSNKGTIAFGPKILQRRPYDHIDWKDLLADARPFQFQNRKLENILVPSPEALAFTKMISFIGRDKMHEKKRLQDLDDFVELTNVENFLHKSLFILINNTNAASDIGRHFRPENEQQLQTLSGSILWRLTQNLFAHANAAQDEGAEVTTGVTAGGEALRQEQNRRIEARTKEAIIRQTYHLIGEFQFRGNQVIAHVHDEYALGLDSSLGAALTELNAVRREHGLREYFASTRFRLIREPTITGHRIDLDLAPINFVYLLLLEDKTVGNWTQEHVRSRLIQMAHRISQSRLQTTHPTLNGLNRSRGANPEHRNERSRRSSNGSSSCGMAIGVAKDITSVEGGIIR